MKLTVFLICFSLGISYAADSYGQIARLSLNVRNVPLQNVLDEIESQSEFNFFYNNKQVNIERLITLKKQNSDVFAVLDELFAGTNVSYKVLDRSIILSSRESNMFRSGVTIAQQSGKRITGVVIDEQGEPLTGSNVVEKGTANGNISDQNGQFAITVSPNAVLQVSYIGYLTQEIRVGDQTNLRIILREDSKMLEEIVVLGYGTTMRRADLSAAVGIVKNVETLKQRPVSSVAEMLQGQIPGVTIQKNSGSPSDDVAITIRGQGSREAEKPLWVVDGVPGAPVNLNDVESIVVLKDAASAAIYGAQSGASGVILVTTKKAKAGKPSIGYEGTFGFSQATRLPQSLLIEDQRAVREKSYADAGQALPDGWDPVKNPYITQNRTDWIDAIFRNAPFQRHNVSINGGTENFANRLSLQYTDEQGVLIGSYRKNFDVRYDAWFNIGEYIRIREDAHWYFGQSRGANTNDAYDGVIWNALGMPRSAEVYYSDGTFGGTAPKDPAYAARYGSNFADIYGDLINPVRALTASNQYKAPVNLHTSTFFEITEPIPGLRYTGRFSYQRSSFFDKNFTPRRTEPGKPDLNNSLGYTTGILTRWEIENRLNYDRTFGKHSLGLMAATTANESRGKSLAVTGRNLEVEDPFFRYLSYASSYDSPTDESTDNIGNDYPDNNVSFVGSATYSWNNRYFATASFRRDYAGRLPAGNKYGDFPAVTVAWKLSEEPFMPKSDFLTLLKLRGGWGRIGNLGTVGVASGYEMLRIWNSGQQGGQVGINSPLVTRMVSNSMAFNPHLTWETSEQSDFGVDINLLNDRFAFTADYFNKRTYNLIKDQQIGWPSMIGVTPAKINEGEIRNTGWEFSAGWSDKVGDVSYYVNANLATLTNKLHYIGPEDPMTGEKPTWREADTYRGGALTPFRTREGDPIYSYWLVESAGLFQSDAEAAAYVDRNGVRIQPNAVAGDLKFIDQNGDGQINDDDRIYMGSYFPKLTCGLSAGFTWKNLSFGLLLQGVGNTRIFHAFKLTTLNESIGNFNRWDKILDAYPKTNDIPRISIFDPNRNFSTNSDWYLENGAYMRIKNLNVSYDLSSLMHRAGHFLDRQSLLSVYASIDNLYTFTNYTGMDPEVGQKGMDSGRYPVPRTVSFGVRLIY